jgi:tellurite resistance protein
MNFLRQLWGNIAGPSPVQEAILDAVCTAVIYDNELTDDEIAYTVEFTATMMGLGTEAAAELVDASLGRIAGRQADEVIDDIVARIGGQEEPSEAALIAAAAAIASDGEAIEEEHQYVHALGQALGFQGERLDAMIAQAAEVVEASA